MPQTVYFSNSAISAESGFDKVACRTDNQQLPVLVLNARDERAIAWLIEQAGFDAVQQACRNIAGNRNPYPTNLAKVLGLSIPQSVIDTPASAARDHIRKLLALLSGSQR